MKLNVFNLYLMYVKMVYCKYDIINEKCVYFRRFFFIFGLVFWLCMIILDLLII